MRRTPVRQSKRCEVIEVGADPFTEETLREMINEAVANGRSSENTHGRPGEIYEYDFGRPIGTTIDGGPATRLRVVVNARGQVVTAFPF